jgi:hypothetical protein
LTSFIVFLSVLLVPRILLCSKSIELSNMCFVFVSSFLSVIPNYLFLICNLFNCRLLLVLLVLPSNSLDLSHLHVTVSFVCVN